MTFDLEAAKRLAQQLAGLVLEAALYSPKLDQQRGGLQSLIAEYPITAEPIVAKDIISDHVTIALAAYAWWFGL